MLAARRSAPIAIAAADPYFAALRDREFARLDEAGLAYLDYTGSAIPAARLLRAPDDLLSDVFGNPHADSAPSRRSTAALDTARARLLAHLDADLDEYVVCFTANATGAVKLVAESYPFAPDGAYVLSADNHNSLNGIREYARRAGTRVFYVPLDSDLGVVGAHELLADAAAAPGRKLFAFPAQSNFSGVRHSLDLIDVAHRFGFDVLLDAAAFLPSATLSLRQYRPAFVALSFYKLFGYPTGLGALVARRDALAHLVRPWFSGGTVEYVSIQNDLHSLIPLPSAGAFEDGTPHFLGAAAVPRGFELLAEAGMDRVAAHVARLTTTLLTGLRNLRHRDDTAVVHVYGPLGTNGRGGTVAFNVVGRDGRVIPYWLVEERARDMRVAFRGGCFCNPGAAEAAFGFDRHAAGRCLRVARRDGFTVQRFAACMAEDSNVAVGAVRASLGLANNDADVGRAIEVVASFIDR
jgi:selenocysteine lyase/cysteine desulfurase